jgi:hypothetical protein
MMIDPGNRQAAAGRERGCPFYAPFSIRLQALSLQSNGQ